MENMTPQVVAVTPVLRVAVFKSPVFQLLCIHLHDIVCSPFVRVAVSLENFGTQRYRQTEHADQPDTDPSVIAKTKDYSDRDDERHHDECDFSRT